MSTTLQRKWTQLHFGANGEANFHWDLSQGGHRRFTLSGLQRLAFFRDVSRDLGSRYGAGGVAKSGEHATGYFSEAMTMLTHSDFFGFDFRDQKKGDLFIYRSLVPGALELFATATVEGVGKLLRSEWGARLYIYNVSSMQRELAQRVLNLKSIDPDGDERREKPLRHSE